MKNASFFHTNPTKFPHLENELSFVPHRCHRDRRRIKRRNGLKIPPFPRKQNRNHGATTAAAPQESEHGGSARHAPRAGMEPTAAGTARRRRLGPGRGRDALGRRAGSVRRRHPGSEEAGLRGRGRGKSAECWWWGALGGRGREEPKKRAVVVVCLHGPCVRLPLACVGCVSFLSRAVRSGCRGQRNGTGHVPASSFAACIGFVRLHRIGPRNHSAKSKLYTKLVNHSNKESFRALE